MKLFGNKPVIRFVSRSGHPLVHEMTCIRPAREIKPSWYVEQRSWSSDRKFANCPGMLDAMQAGYIMPAWTDIHIKANTAGAIVTYNKAAEHYSRPKDYMSNDLTGNFIEVADDVKFTVNKISPPWDIFAAEGYSVWITAPLYHAPYLRDLHIYPGIVDCDGLPTLNVIFTPLRACEIHIPIGAPLLQIIPFKRENMHAEVAKASTWEKMRIENALPTRVRGIYRKLFHRKKIYTSEIKKGD